MICLAAPTLMWVCVSRSRHKRAENRDLIGEAALKSECSPATLFFPHPVPRQSPSRDRLLRMSAAFCAEKPIAGAAGLMLSGPPRRIIWPTPELAKTFPNFPSATPKPPQ